MKNLFLLPLVLMTFTQVVCADTPTTSERVSAVIEDVKVSPINGGFNPAFHGYRIQGRVMIAANACVAQNKTIVPSIESEAGVTHVSAWRVTDLSQPVAMCPMIYKPVYYTLDLQVRTQESVVVDNVGELEKSVGIDELMADAEVEVDVDVAVPGRPGVIEDFSSRPINGGFNPAYKAYELSGRVMLGTNKCRAQGVTATLEVRKGLDQATHVMAKIKSGARVRARMCTTEYAPVYWTFEKRQVRGLQIIVHHVGSMNTTKRL